VVEIRLKYYLRNYAELTKLNVQTWMEYRLDFLIGISAVFLTNITTIAFFWVLFQHIPNLNGWSFEQLLFINGFSIFTVGIWHAFLTGCSGWEMDRLVRIGDLDRILLRPMNALVHLVIRRLDDDGFGDVLAGILLLAYSSSKLGILWTAQNVAALAVLSAGSLLIIFSVNIMIAAMAFWATQVRSFMDLFWSVLRFTDYPINIYGMAFVWFFTYVLPFGFINFYPAQYFLGNNEWMMYAYATPFVGLLMFAIAYSIWKAGLKKYASAGH
jgi:ABC-2 type transport system permease protein